MVQIRSDIDSIDLRRAHAWIASTYWSTGIPFETFERACSNSLVFAAFEDDDQIGFARVVTDQATFAWLCDVYVVPGARGRGVARRLMETIMADSRVQGLRNFVLATRDAHGLYQRFGFEPVGEPNGRLMRISRSPSGVYGEPASGRD